MIQPAGGIPILKMEDQSSPSLSNYLKEAGIKRKPLSKKQMDPELKVPASAKEVRKGLLSKIKRNPVSKVDLLDLFQLKRSKIFYDPCENRMIKDGCLKKMEI